MPGKRRTTTKVLRLPCQPVGSLAPYRPAHDTGCSRCGHPYACHICHVPLQNRALANGSDWAYFDSDGNIMGETPYPPMHPGMAETFRDQARRTKGSPEKRAKAVADMEVWLSWRTGASVSIDFRLHTHSPASHTCPVSAPYPVPFCCAQPMWWSPAGWACRVTKTVFGTTLGGMFTVTGTVKATGEPYDATITPDSHKGVWGVVQEASASVLALLATLDGEEVTAGPSAITYTLGTGDAASVLAALHQHTNVQAVTGDAPDVVGQVPTGAIG